MIMHDHHHDMPTFVASAHTFDFTGGSLSFWCRGKFSDAFGGGELHQEQLDDVMGQTVWIHTSIGGWCEPTKRVGITWGNDAVNSLQCHWNDGNWTGDEWGNKFKLAQLFRWVDYLSPIYLDKLFLVYIDMVGYSQNMRSNFDFFPSLWLPWTFFFFVAAGISIQNLKDLDQVNGIQCPSWSAGQVPGDLEGSSNAWCHWVPLPHLVAAQCRGPADQKQRDMSTHWLSFCWPVDGTANEPILMMAANGVAKGNVDPIRAIACYLFTFT